MSRVTELAELEASEAEAEEPNEEEAAQEAEEERESEVEPEPVVEPETEAAVKDHTKKLDAEDERHERAVMKLYGDMAADVAPCPLCLNHGFVPSEAPPEFNQDQREAVLWAMGEGRYKLKTHPTFERCTLCDGFGKLETGARNEPGNNAINCPDCQSRGYVDPKELERMAQAGLDAAYVPPPTIVVSPMTALANGSPAGDPNSPPQPWFDYSTNQWKV